MSLVVYLLLMVNAFKATLLSTVFVINWLEVAGQTFDEMQSMQNNVKVELLDTINTIKVINARILTDAALCYFDEEVKLYKLKPEIKKQVDNILMSYFSKHAILKIKKDGVVTFEIDDKKAFSKMIDKLTHTLLDSMPYLIRKIAVAFVFGGEWKLQKQLDELDTSVWNMKSRQYKDVVFDYMLWIIKRAVIDVNWKMVVKDYYKNVNNYYPNKNSSKILNELYKSNQAELDIKDFDYSF